MFGGGFFQNFPGGFSAKPQKTDNTRFYEILGANRNSTDAELKKLHRKLALKYHPDKPGGDAEKFKEINTAFEVLRDPEKRKIYDEYGEEAVKDGASQPSMGGDIFDLFGGVGRSRPRERRGENVTHRLKVSLEELYNGATRKLSLTRNALCQTCDGRGTKSGQRYTCDVCHGSTVHVMMRPLGPGMMQQIQQPCTNCNQTGYAAPAHDVCTSCKGKTITPEKKVFEVHIDRGRKHQSKIVLRGEAGRSDPDMQPGDVIFILEQKPHDFKRINSDLVYEKELSLSEALCGTSFTIKHLDERVLSVTIAPGEVIKPDSWKCINDEGMPEFGRPYENGNMYLHFNVKFPDSLTQSQVNSLKGVFDVPNNMNGNVDLSNTEQVTMRHINEIEDEFKTRRQHSKDNAAQAYDSSDDEDGRGGQRVQCAQQ